MQGNIEQNVESRTSRLTRHDIGRIVTKTFEVSFDECCLLTRQRKFVRARWAAWVLMMEFKPESSWVQLARVFSKDHTSVMNGIEQAELLLKHDMEFSILVAKARKAIQNGGGVTENTSPAVACTLDAAQGPNIIKSQPAAKSEPAISFAKMRQSNQSLDSFDKATERWWRQNDDRFRAAMMAAYPGHVSSNRAEAEE